MASPAELAAFGANVMTAPVHLQLPKTERQGTEVASGQHGSGVPPGTGSTTTDVGKRKPRKGATGDADGAAKPKPRKILI